MWHKSMMVFVGAVFCTSAVAQEIAVLVIGTNHPVRYLQYSPDGSMLASVSGSDMSVWDLKKKERLWNGGFPARFCEMPTFVPGRLLVATHHPEDKEASYDVRGFTMATIHDAVRFTHDDKVLFQFPWPEQPIAISERSVITRLPDAERWLDEKKRIKRLYKDKKLNFHLAGQEKPKVFAPDRYFTVIGLSADKAWLILDFEKPREIGLLDVTTQRIVYTAKAPVERLGPAVLTRDKRSLITRAWPGNDLHLRDLKSDELKVVRIRRAEVMALSLDDRILAVSGQGCVDFVDTKTMAVVGRETWDVGNSTCIQFAPDSRSYAVGDQDGKIRILKTPKLE